MDLLDRSHKLINTTVCPVEAEIAFFIELKYFYKNYARKQTFVMTCSREVGGNWFNKKTAIFEDETVNELREQSELFKQKPTRTLFDWLHNSMNEVVTGKQTELPTTKGMAQFRK